MLDNTNGNTPNDIAIVGMALRVPGARTVGEFWENLRSGTESIRTLTVEELVEAGEPASRIHNPNYVRRTADLAGMDMFDAEFFGLSPKEAAIMDPQHRQFLECVWEAMEDAGRVPEPTGGPVGVFAGSGMGSYFYFNVCSNRALVDQVGMFLLRHTGNDKDFLATRASFTFDLRGPSVNIQTACSTSLVAVHHACQSLLNGECDMALAGGVTIELPHRRGYLFQEGEILSPDGHCRAFDHRAAGTVFGSGVGVVALRRLSDALEDRDHIHAVIKATAINNDGGTKAGYLAPSVTGQAAAIVEAQGLASISADTIQYVECHGTGTPIGDPIEIEALTQAFRQSTDRRSFCRVGSVKSNIGHLDTAAGVVGLIKTALAVEHGEIPATLGFERPNPAIDFAASPFVVCSELTPWPSTQGRRRAAVNSLGVGGTNAHVIVEQAPHRSSGHSAGGPVLFVLSARQQAALDEAATALSGSLQARPDQPVEDVAYTLWNGRKRFDHCRLIAARDRADAISALAKARPATQGRIEPASGAVFLFAGGGAQHRGMAADLYRHDAFFRATVDEGLGYLPGEAARQIRDAWLGVDSPASGDDTFLKPSVQLPAILILEVALARSWMRAGVEPTALIGHSMGENAAACVAGVFTFRDAVRLVRLRGELFDTVPRGGMLSVPLSGSELRDLLPETLDIASLNAPGLAAVSGSNEDLEAFAAMLETRDIGASRIPIDIAAHSRMLDFILPRWEAFLRSLPLNPPKYRIVSNLTGEWLTGEQATDPMYWVRHLRSTVLFADGMAKLTATSGLVYIDVGPGRTMSSLAKAQGSLTADQVINSLPHQDDDCDDSLHFLTALGRAAICGLPVEPSLFWDGGPRSRTSLPTYPFQHKRYFIEPAKRAESAATEPEFIREPDMVRWGHRPVWKQSLPDCEPGLDGAPRTWLIFLDDHGVGAGLVDRLRRQDHTVTTVSRGDAFVRHAEGAYTLCPELGLAGYSALLEGLASDGRLPSSLVHLWLLTSRDDARPGSNFFHRNQDCGFYSLFHLAQAIGETEIADPIHVTVVTNGMHRVAGEALPHPEKATVLGPALVMPREIPGATVRLIDMEANSGAPAGRWPFRKAETRSLADDQVAEMLWSDLTGGAASEVVAYRGGKRWTRSFAPAPLDGLAGGETLVRQGGVYLFTGGLGDIATALAGELAAKFAAKLVLVGRTSLPPRASWQAYRRQNGRNAVRRGIETVLSLEAAGADVLYCCADVTNPDSMAKAIDEAVRRFGRIDGVFHAAGTVDDGLMGAKSPERMNAVLAPKLHGTRVLDAVLSGRDIDFLVLFSSTSTVTAPAGQADYVAANAFLDAYAESCAGRTDRRTIALHWGIWNEIGLAARGTGLNALRTAGEEPATTGGTLYQRWAEDDGGVFWLEAEIGPRTHWILDEHRLVSNEAVLPGTAYFELIAHAAREHGLGDDLLITDLTLLKPLVVPDDATRVVQTAIQRAQDGWQIMVRAGIPGEPATFGKHAEARLHIAGRDGTPRLDVETVSRRLPAPITAREDRALPSAQQRHIRFGERWQVLRSTSFGPAEAIAEVALRPEHRADLASGVIIHPALLDIATGFAMPLVEAFRDSDVLWAPASYGAVRLRGPLPERLVSHVSLVSADDLGEDYAAFDIRIADPAGNLVFEVERFLMKRLTGDSEFTEAKATGAGRAAGEAGRATSPAMIRLASQVQQGIRPAEGLEALLRALGSGLTQPIVSSIDLRALLASASSIDDGAAPETGTAFERPDIGAAFVAPRNAVETTLAGFWQELLGVSKIGMDDSFFDLGGHSLVAVRLFRMIKKEFGIDLPISVLFSAPTIAQCAELIGERSPQGEPSGAQDASAADAARLVHLTMMSQGPKDAIPLFICAGMFGNILNLRHLAQHLGATRPVYGLQARGLYGDMAPHESFEDMAADYLAEIRTVRRTGPYLLAGYSGGGITAFEMARQLRESGEIVPQVIMLDTPQPTQPPLSFADKLAMKSQDLRRHRLTYLNQWLKTRTAWRDEMRRKRAGAGSLSPAAADQFNNDRIEAAFRQACSRYAVARCDGPVTVFRPRPEVHYRLGGGRRLMANRDIVLDDNGWSAHVGRLDIVEVPGDHDTMVLEPHVRVLAEGMRQAIEQSLRFLQPGIAVSGRSSAPADRRQLVTV